MNTKRNLFTPFNRLSCVHTSGRMNKIDIVRRRERCQFIGDTVINSLFNPGFVQQNRDVPVRVRPGTAGIAVIVRTT